MPIFRYAPRHKREAVSLNETTNLYRSKKSILGFYITRGNIPPASQDKELVLYQMTQFVEVFVVLASVLAILFGAHASLLALHLQRWSLDALYLALMEFSIFLHF